MSFLLLSVPPALRTGSSCSQVVTRSSFLLCGLHRCPAAIAYSCILAPPTKPDSGPSPLSSSSQNSSYSSAASRAQLLARHLSTNSQRTADMSRFSVRKIGAPNTLEHRVYIEKDGQPCSPFHDVPLYANEQQNILNMIVEIPRWTNGKLEVRLQTI